jgi:hypothetical protein
VAEASDSNNDGQINIGRHHASDGCRRATTCDSVVRMRVYVRVAGVVLLCASGCFPSITYGPNVQLDCTSDDDCPADLVCATEVGRCAPVGAAFDTTPPQVLTATATPTVSSSSVASVVTITATEPLAQLPVLRRLRTRDGDNEAIDLVEVANDDGSVSVTVAADAFDVSGAVSLEVELVDIAGNTTTESVNTALVFDVDGPQLLDADVEIAAEPTTNVLYPAAPTAARADSTAVVDVLLTEPATAATAALFTENDDEAIAVDLSLVIAVDDARRLSTTLPPALIATLDDGTYVVHLDTTDAVGNTSTIVVDVPVEVDHTPPAPPQLTELVRAPWGSALAEDATSATGTVDDAVLVLGVLAGTTVDPGAITAPPPSVNRVAPVDGAFSFSFPVDIADVGAVAVDRAGNLSAVALAATTRVHASVSATSSPHRVASRQVFLPRLKQRGDVDHTRALREGAAAVSAATWWEPLTSSTFDTFSDFPLLAFEPQEHLVLVVARGQTFKLVGHDLIATGAPPLPTHREGTLVTDEDRGVVVYFGGTRLDGTTTNELYEWNGTAWEQRLVDVPADQMPAPRAGHSMVWAPGQGLLIVNGCGAFAQIGIAGCLEPLPAETWRYDGTRMQLLCRGADCGTAPLPLRPALVVDGDRRVLAFGGSSLEPIAVAPGQPTVSVFQPDTGTWTGECSGAGCNNATFNAGAFVDDNGDVQLLGQCGGAKCFRRYVDEQFVSERLVAVPDFTFRFESVQQPAWLAVRGVGVFVGTITNGGSSGAVLKLVDDALLPYAPMSMTPRCGGAAFSVAGATTDDVLVAAGCSECAISPVTAAQVCTDPLSNAERLVDDVVDADSNGPAGYAFATDVGGPLLVQQRTAVVDGRLAVQVASHHYDGVSWNAHTPTTIPIDNDGRLARVMGAYVDPSDTSRAIVLVGSGFVDEHPNPLDLLLSVNRDGVVDVACGVDCGTLSLGAGHPAVGAASSFAVAFSGANALRPTDTTAVARGASLTSIVPTTSPDGRRGGVITGDRERDVAWLVGGNLDVAQPTGNDVFRCNGESDVNCSDIQAFDGTSWQEFIPVDVLGTGRPGSRLLAQTTHNGALTIVGGTSHNQTLEDAWRLHTSSTTSPATLFTVDLQAFGAGTTTTPASVDLVWCGEALDAAGGTADVALSVWTGTRFVRLTTRNEPELAASLGAACVRGTSTDTVESLQYATQRQQLVVAAHVDAAPATGFGMPSLRTEVLEPVVVYQR